MNRFKLPDDDEPKLFSNCCSCDKELFLGDEYIEYYGSVSCDEYKCVLKMVGAERRFAEDDV